ncbi:hypothetical protein [Streptococcus pluranimalium]|uniref:hypothetical protein n=1 Tax=Streptococcus pluranimalium TaxID=82348 RepID=UPI0039FD8647
MEKTIKKTTTINIEDGRVKKFELNYTNTHTDDDFSRVNYFTPASDLEEMTVNFTYKGYKLSAPSWKVNEIPENRKQKSDLEKQMIANGFTCYIQAKTESGKTAFVGITKAEYEAIKGWFKTVKIQKEEKTEIKSTQKDYSKEIEKAKETGKKVIISRNAIDSQNSESDTEIVTRYIDANGKITETIESMS